MMLCNQCGEVFDLTAKFCRRCGAAKVPYDPGEVSVKTEPISPSKFFNAKQAKPVIPLKDVRCTIEVKGFRNRCRLHGVEHPRCMIEISFRADWLIGNIDISKIDTGDDEIKKAVERCAGVPRDYDFSSVPLSEIRFALEKGCKKLFDKVVNIRVERPEKNISSRTTYKKYGISIGHAYATFRLSLVQHINDIYEDKKLIVQKLTDLLNSLYDWSAFYASIEISFLFPFDELKL